MSTNVNRNHKSSVFSALFSNPEILRELYSAIAGIEIPPNAIIDINTLSEALFMKQINDLSFTINDRIVVLIEHQSTLNENVPLRLLMYIARVYEKIIEKEKIYKKKLVKIPTPEFIILYNGKEECPDHSELRLSTAFKDITGLKLSDNTDLPLELVVQVYNINHGRNMEILGKSKTLCHYSIFIGKINEFKQKMSIEEAVQAAVKYCIDHDILKEFLLEHSPEVVNMLFDEMTIEEIAAVRYKEGHEEGHEEGREEGRKDERIIIAGNLLSEGSPPEFVQKTTGLSLEEIKKLY